MTDSYLPHSILLFNGTKTLLVASGQHIQLIDAQIGNVTSSTINASADVKNSLSKSGPIRYIAVDSLQRHFLTLGDDKKLKVWKLEGLELLHERELPKRPMSACFTADDQTIVVADKFGDVFSYTLHPSKPDTMATSEASAADASAPETKSESEQELEADTSKKKKSKKQRQKENPPHPRDSTASHVNPSNGTLILGHTSMLTSLLLTQDEKYIITTDRDEHIRVSWYPQGYIIETYCLGCSQFISCLHIPPSQPSLLISGGGDPELKVWDWFSGQLKFNIPILDSVKKYIQVTVQPYIRKKARQNANAGPDADESMADGTATPDEEVSESPAPGQSEEQIPGETILVVHKISTVERHGNIFIVFSVVGASAIFVTEFSSSSSPSAVQALSLDHPVLDFIVDDSGLIWATVDVTLTRARVSWDGKTIPTSTPSSSIVVPVRLAEVNNDRTVTEPSLDSLPVPTRSILETLNSKCLLPASSTDLSALNLYSSLTSLPKNNRSGEDGEGDEDVEEGKPKQKQEKRAQGITRDLGKGKKEEGKTRSKMAVAERKRMLEGGEVKGTQEAGNVKADEGRQTKRPRSEVGSADVTMTESEG
ncbi:wd repeat-containing protein [Moniliophthora roreri MCA 2997]|uniref:Wd repeat-containing protein n=2 Tax=Moniliophthora roreri TaxID=221103 RepID=V2XVT0_MONRO|nr:wd repeat-containing protein [Moniliophthora roreri MCA 2997]KAI3602650.1 wd repeat-containing protein [Moniliophthora roreri]